MNSLNMPPPAPTATTGINEVLRRLLGAGQDMLFISRDTTIAAIGTITSPTQVEVVKEPHKA